LKQFVVLSRLHQVVGRRCARLEFHPLSAMSCGQARHIHRQRVKHSTSRSPANNSDEYQLPLFSHRSLILFVSGTRSQLLPLEF